ncbi:hypothetical protein [Bacteroides congonensis]|nr:hypothetical protein [Bacteroides congonensis]
MEAQERIETRKDEIRYRTADQRRMVGKFLAEKVCKSGLRISPTKKQAK